MPFLLPLATSLTAVLTVKTLNKTARVVKKRQRRKQRIDD